VTLPLRAHLTSRWLRGHDEPRVDTIGFAIARRRLAALLLTTPAAQRYVQTLPSNLALELTMLVLDLPFPTSSTVANSH
jgi:hypothetical protein